MDFSFKNIVREEIMLSEAKKLSDINSISNFSALEPERIEQIAEIDPTYKGNGYAGKFTIWLIDKFVNNEFNMSQSNDLTEALENFQRLRGQLENKNINTMSVKDLLSLEEKHTAQANEDGVITDFPPMREMIKRRWSAWYLKIFDDGSNQVFVPLTYEAARKLGGNAEWCTSSSDPFYFDYYTQGWITPLEILYKNGKPYAQLNREEPQLKNTEDDEFYGDFDFPDIDVFSIASGIAGDYLQRAYQFYLTQRFEKLKASELTSRNTKIGKAANGICGYLNGGLWGIARYDSGGSITPITRPEWGIPISNRCGMITFMELPDIDNDPDNGAFNYDDVDYSITLDYNGRPINCGGEIEEALKKRLSLVHDGKYRLEDAFDMKYDESDGTTYLFDLDMHYGIQCDGPELIDYGTYIYNRMIGKAENIG